ncbi:MAG: short-chain dehydrogenase [Bacteroidetes bacterium]|nr:short-chain dehydrogenase [Bacteroidota bacterium]
MSKFNNKTVVITGGNSGMGLATAKSFLAEGAHVIITGRSQDNLDKATATLASDKLTTVVSDLSGLAGIETLVEAVKKTGRKVDTLFLNAGIAQFLPIEHTTEEAFDSMFNTNVKGLYFTLQKMLPYLSDGASVILNSSVVATGAMANASAYAATKAAVSSIGRIAATELAAKNIRVNIVSPGPIDTPIFDKGGYSDAEKQGMRDMLTAAVPLGRLGTSDEVAKAVVYLSSPEAAFITGAELLVDGGIGLRR